MQKSSYSFSSYSLLSIFISGSLYRLCKFGNMTLLYYAQAGTTIVFDFTPKRVSSWEKKNSINVFSYKHTQQQMYKLGLRKSLRFKLLKMRTVHWNCHLFMVLSDLFCKRSHHLSVSKNLS